MKLGFETSRLRVERSQLDAENIRTAGAGHMAKASVIGLGLDRASVWLFTPDHKSLKLLAAFDAKAGKTESGTILLMRDARVWLDFLKHNRSLTVPDCSQPHAADQLKAQYIDPYQIGALVQAPIIHFGNLIGVLSLECTSGARAWSSRDVDFAIAAADALSCVLDQSERLEQQASVGRTRETKLVADKMRALERLAAGVTLEMKNVLSGVKQQTDRLRRDLGAASEKGINAVSEAFDRAAQLTQQLSRFGDGTFAASQTDLAELLNRLKPTFERLKGSRPFVQMIEVQEALWVKAPAQELEQAVRNLFNNALDATSENQGITIRLQRQMIDGVPSAVLEVSDGGAGISEEMQARIFEPYFTTKASGAGFGLASVYGTVRRAGGFIEIESEPKHGTSFKIQFPLSSKAGSKSESRSDSSNPSTSAD